MIDWKERRTLKSAREILRGGHKWLRINRDLLSDKRRSEIETKLQELGQALNGRRAAEATTKADEVERTIQEALPPQGQSWARENIEVLLVAVIVAMAIRTFFIQPFKIPTGSMQPTLYGIYPPPESAPPTPYATLQGPSVLDKIVGILFQGKMYEEYGYRSRGDHIFVDKLSYHFRKPVRGEVIVFDTSHITELGGAARGKFYIKRLIGLPNDVIEIQPPHVLVNGQILDTRPAFERIYSCQNGYSGYVIINGVFGSRYLRTPTETYTVPPNHLFAMGDNSRSSLDGRFWGSLPESDLVGRAVFVYWPFTKRFGRID
ncbi:MAG TPA: signal peptidase I [Verrucomicrobiae bacterium]|nr:signal peptidase I [Verrucomicrobiae bacterium]